MKYHQLTQKEKDTTNVEKTHEENTIDIIALQDKRNGLWNAMIDVFALYQG